LARIGGNLHRTGSRLRPVRHLLPGPLANYNPLAINPPWIAHTSMESRSLREPPGFGRQ
jgi:hypothetical protein